MNTKKDWKICTAINLWVDGEEQGINCPRLGLQG
jgi:hypothetical protein